MPRSAQSGFVNNAYLRGVLGSLTWGYPPASGEQRVRCPLFSQKLPAADAASALTGAVLMDR